jgi:hypothetical protein
VTAIDSGCVEHLVEVHRGLAADGRRLTMVQASREVVDALVAFGAWERFS